MVRKPKNSSNLQSEPPAPAPDVAAEQLAALADRVSALEAELAALKATVAGSLGISV